uniref:Uncharacterized protein n=1 Tax=Pristionchus pacificus TaxID=54126 RepID=A0A2A6D0T3_PRIPA|eukprot:PDM83999.1 hypothetical protein PRIPAC_34191 [Pristionchus pacificus]
MHCSMNKCRYCMTHTGHSRPEVEKAAEKEERESLPLSVLKQDFDRDFVFMISRTCDIQPESTISYALSKKDNKKLERLRERLRSQIEGFPAAEVVIKKRIQYTQGETRQENAYCKV